MKYVKELFKIFTGAIVGFVVTLVIAYSTFARAETKAILDTVNRAFFIAQGAQNMVIGSGASATGTITLQAKGTPVVDITTNGFEYRSGKAGITAPATAVFASTAVAGTNVLVPGYNIPGATATANHLALIGSATTIPGATYDFYNASGATLKLKAPSGVTMNGATAGGTLLVATLISATCKVTSATNIDCRLNTNPTPAAP